MKKYIVVLLALASVVGYSHAISWESALGIDIITRAEWGADETWRRVSAFGISNTPTPLGVKDKSIIDHLKAYFASDLKLDEVDDYEGGEELWWPLEYKEDKKGIAIHHTVSSQETIDAQGGVIPHLQQMYKFHTFTRGWGDIGYNFLIDQDGNIYEGRA
ncbi:MAG: N-acetylmuramoyl-L-alanine amidase [Candidatus Peribacteria bacterium]|nr:MAG: N-acetylmuramoyl-L-alanine amidase [Candidatus Peribacteria bacterium]